MFLGVDLGGTKTAVCIGTQAGEILQKIKFPTQDPEQTLARIISEGKVLIGDKPLLGIGVSCGSPQDSAKGIIQAPPNLPQWKDVPITQILSTAFGAKAWLANDANACALAEWKYGAGRGVQNMLFLTFGTGLGAGVILDGKLYEGVVGMAGEVGHIRLAEDGPLGYGKHGSFEGFCSGGGIALLGQKKAETALISGEPFDFCQTQSQINTLSTKQIADAAMKGDPNAKEIFEESGRRLGQGLAVLVDCFNPERIVIGSVFARAEALLRPAMEQVLQAEALSENLRACRIVPAQLGESIGDVAALSVAVQGYESNADTIWRRYPGLAECEVPMRHALDILKTCVNNGNKILLCGNGGSAADCEHIAGELLKGFRKKRKLSLAVRQAWEESFDREGLVIADILQDGIPAISLPSFCATLTAVANDTAADMIFAQMVWTLGKPGDVLIGLSTSGGAINVQRAAQAARIRGMRVIVLTGRNESKLSELADAAIRVPEQETYKVQELHLPVYHWLCAELEASLFEN